VGVLLTHDNTKIFNWSIIKANKEVLITQEHEQVCFLIKKKECKKIKIFSHVTRVSNVVQEEAFLACLTLKITTWSVLEAPA